MGNRVIYTPAYDAEVEYLESTGTQWIDTGIVPIKNTRVVAKLYTEQDTNKNWFGSERFDTTPHNSGYVFNQMNGRIEYLFGDSGWKEVSASYSLLNRTFDIDYSNVALKVDDATLATSLCSNFHTQTKSMLIYWRQGTPSTSRISGRVYYFKIYQNSTLVRDFIPVRIGNVGYMYDKVTKQLFGNKGTGSFTIGNDVSNAVIPQQRCVILFPMYDSQVEYLESTGTQWIDTGIVPDDTYGFYIRAYLTQLSSSRNQKCVGTGTYQNNKRFWVNFSISGKLEISWNTYEEGVDYSDNTWYEITNNYLNSRIGTIDGVTKRTDYPTLNTIETSICMFGIGGDRFAGRISNVRISKSSEIVRDFIPVRIGSTGYMYDKVSKRLFANKGTGNFILGSDTNDAVASQRSVVFERIYEEYEWLVGDGSAYIDTNIKPSENLRTKIKFAYTDSSDSIAKNSSIFGSGITNSGTISNRYWVNYDNKFEVGYGAYYTTQYIINPNQDIEIDFNYIEDNTHKFRINNTVYPNWSGEPNTTQNIVIFGRNVSGTIYVSNSRVSYFQLINSSNLIMDLIPVRLLHSIPASLDANGIARQAGECGMWDKVSGRFFGNVASNGTFKAVNLAEGVDYEVYDWLHFDSNGSVNAEFMSLPINSSVFNFTRKFIKYDNNSYLWTGSATFSYSCYYNIINIYDFENNTVIYKSNSSLASVNGIVAINSSVSSLTFNEEQVPQYDFPIGSIKWKVASMSDGTIFDTSSITVDGIERYIPVKLLRSIPSKYDANGISRNANECGMYDTVNDVFYGNVANSGSFTVSND